jgi:hypothetical protein
MSDPGTCISKHAAKRMRQRGVSSEKARLILEHGNHFRASGGAVRCMITKQQIADHVRDLKREIRCWESLRGTALIVADDGDLITVQHQIRRQRAA